ncbi:MAG: UDP-glucose/GDP-mannose dehydrogenase family protein [Nitriliruptoraceae bacterium]|nr:UDP-glucose/GDP-mannose dehydrogenase family protein [Nitriliruptoraceae bacterium]
MNITVVGVGHVGLVSAAAFARWGHDVVGYDDDAAKVATMQGGAPWFYEPGLQELLSEVTEAGRLRFTSDSDDALRDAEIVFVCVGTPPLPGGGPNLSYVEAVGRTVVAQASRELVLVEKSTVPANTGRRLEQVIARETERLGLEHAIHVASNPEFLKEGAAVEDTLHPDRVVYGTSSDFARDALRAVYAPLVEQDGCPVVETDVASAELIKHASNAFLATRISFINAVAQICDRVGADVQTVAEGMGHDVRIGHRFLQAGLGYGGSCFPKDVDAFAHLASQVGYEFGLLDEVRDINAGQRAAVIRKLEHELWHLNGKTIALLGAAFKPGTDDLRESPALHLADDLIALGAEVRIYDPVALPNVEVQRPDLPRAETIDAALAGAHAAVVCTDWDDIKKIEPQRFLEGLAYPIVIDGRNVYDPEAFIGAGLRYHSMGRTSVA